MKVYDEKRTDESANRMLRGKDKGLEWVFVSDNSVSCSVSKAVGSVYVPFLMRGESWVAIQLWRWLGAR